MLRISKVFFFPQETTNLELKPSGDVSSAAETHKSLVGRVQLSAPQAGQKVGSGRVCSALPWTAAPGGSVLRYCLVNLVHTKHVDVSQTVQCSHIRGWLAAQNWMHSCSHLGDRLFGPLLVPLHYVPPKKLYTVWVTHICGLCVFVTGYRTAFLLPVGRTQRTFRQPRTRV